MFVERFANLDQKPAISKELQQIGTAIKRTICKIQCILSYESRQASELTTSESARAHLHFL